MSKDIFACQYCKNYDTKHKTWRDGILVASWSHGTVKLYLYNEDDYSRNATCASLDVFDLFNIPKGTLSGRQTSSNKYIIQIGSFMNAYITAASNAPAALTASSMQQYTSKRSLGTRRRFRGFNIKTALPVVQRITSTNNTYSTRFTIINPRLSIEDEKHLDEKIHGNVVDCLVSTINEIEKNSL